MNSEKLRRTVSHVTGLLEKEAYEALAILTRGVRLTADEMREAIRDYGRRIAPFPEAGYLELNVVEVRGTNPRQWSVDVPLFTGNEGRSDLTLSITLTESNALFYEIEIDGIHVL